MDQKMLLFLYKNCIKNSFFKKITIFSCHYLPMAVVFLYLAIAVCLGLKNDIRLWNFLLAPGITLALVTWIRKGKNRPRPFESIAHIVPLVEHSKGESFPSRHMSSSCIIALSLLPVSVPLSIFCFLLSFFIGLSRIAAGIHYPSDILAGMVISFLVGILFLLFAF